MEHGRAGQGTAGHGRAGQGRAGRNVCMPGRAPCRARHGIAQYACMPRCVHPSEHGAHGAPCLYVDSMRQEQHGMAWHGIPVRVGGYMRPEWHVMASHACGCFCARCVVRACVHAP
eukprot:301083-Chlamydomonas_euryale.AAC.2